MGTVSLAVLLAANRRTSSLVEAFAGTADSWRPARFPGDLLLLPQGVLSCVLPGPAGLRGDRVEAELQRRNEISIYSAERAPIFSVFRDSVSLFSVERRDSSVFLRREIWDGRGHVGTVGEYHSPDHVHAFLPLVAALGGRPGGLFFVRNI